MSASAGRTAHWHSPRCLPRPAAARALLSPAAGHQLVARPATLSHCLPRTTSSFPPTPLPASRRASSRIVQAGSQPAQPAPQQKPLGKRVLRKHPLRGVSKAQLLAVLEHQQGAPPLAPLAESEFQYLPPLHYVQYMVAALHDDFGAEATADLLRCSVRVLTAGPPSQIRRKMDAVAAAYGCDHVAALQLCARKRYLARLLQYTPQQLELVFAAVRECLGLETAQELREACCGCASLLEVAPDMLLARRAALGSLLQLEGHELALFLRQRPGLLCKETAGPAPELRERLKALGSLLRLDGDALVQLLRRRPALLWTDAAQVGAALEAVQAALELGSREEAVRVAMRNPDLLVHDPKTVVDTVTWMKLRLQRSGSDLKQCAMVLKRPVGNLEAAWQELPQALGITPEEARQLVVEAPDLLLKAGSSVAAAWAVLKRAAGLQQAWREELLAATPSILIRCLGTKAQRLSERLQEVADASLPPGQHRQLPGLLTLSKMKEDHFRAAMQRLHSGTYFVTTKPRRLKPTSLAVLFPSLAAQLGT